MREWKATGTSGAAVEALPNPLDHPICFTTPKRLTPVSAWHEHIPFAMFLVEMLRPRVVVELGTCTGDSYCGFCQAVRELNLDTRCHAVDTWKGDPQTGFYEPSVLADLRAHHDPLYGDFSRLIQSTFDDALQYFADGTVDVLHIDGCHTYDAVKHDFESWLPKVSAHGVVLLHDTEVRDHDFGVREFWEEIKPRYPHFELVHGHGLGVLAVGAVRPPELQALFGVTGERAANIRNFFFVLGRGLTAMVERNVLQGQVESLRAQVESLAHERALILGSKSWRLTAPLRWAGLRLRSLYPSIAARAASPGTPRGGQNGG